MAGRDAARLRAVEQERDRMAEEAETYAEAYHRLRARLPSLLRDAAEQLLGETADGCEVEGCDGVAVALVRPPESISLSPRCRSCLDHDLRAEQYAPLAEIEEADR